MIRAAGAGVVSPGGSMSPETTSRCGVVGSGCNIDSTSRRSSMQVLMTSTSHLVVTIVGCASNCLRTYLYLQTTHIRAEPLPSRSGVD